MVRIFPPAVRFSGVSVSFNVAQAVFGGFTPLLVSWLAHLDPIGPAHYVTFTTALGALSLLLIPSTAQLPRRGWAADSVETPGEARGRAPFPANPGTDDGRLEHVREDYG